MTINNFFGIFFFFIILNSAAASVFSKNAVYSVLFLVISFISSASLLLLCKSDFIAFLFIIIYVGAIAVLFLFVIMMLEVKIRNVDKFKNKFLPTGFYVTIGFLLSSLINNFDYWFKMTNPYYSSFKYNEYQNWLSKIEIILDIQTIGRILYTYYVIAFLISGFLLFLAVLGSVSLTINFKVEQNLTDLAKQF